MSQSIREFMGIGAQGIGASQPAKKPGLRETFKEFFKKDNLKRAMIPRTISQGVSGLMDVYNRGRLPGESKMSFVDLLKDDLRQITVSDKDFKAGKTGITSMKPFKAFTPKMMATGPTPLVRQTVERALGPVGALATAGQVGYGVGNILMDVTGTRDDVSAAGAALANTQIGQQLAEALGVPQTPNLQQGIQTIEPEPVPREFRKLTFEVDPRNPFGADTAESALSYLNRTRLGSLAFQPEYYYYGEGDDFYPLGGGKIYDSLMNPDLTSLGAYTSTPISFGQLPTNLQQYGIGEFLP